MGLWGNRAGFLTALYLLYGKASVQGKGSVRVQRGFKPMILSQFSYFWGVKGFGGCQLREKGVGLSGSESLYASETDSLQNSGTCEGQARKS